MADKPIIDGPVAFFGNSKRWPVTMRWPQTQDVFAVTVRVVGAQGQVRVGRGGLRDDGTVAVRLDRSAAYSG